MGAVDVDGHTIRIKSSPGRVKAEFDDVAQAARDTGLSLRIIAARAEAAWRSEHLDKDVAMDSEDRNRGEDPTA